MRYDRASDRYVPIDWDAAFALIAQHINNMAHPDQVELYTSGRASNEASYLYQLLAACWAPTISPTAQICAMRPAELA